MCKIGHYLLPLVAGFVNQWVLYSKVTFEPLFVVVVVRAGECEKIVAAETTVVIAAKPSHSSGREVHNSLG